MIYINRLPTPPAYSPRMTGKRVIYLLGCIGLVVIGYLALTVVHHSAGMGIVPSPPPVESHQHEMMRAAAGRAMALRQATRDPASFEIVNVILMAADGICFEFRGNNGFGGKNVELAVDDGKVLRTQSMAGFDRAYRHVCNTGKSGADVTSDVAAILKYTKP